MTNTVNAQTMNTQTVTSHEELPPSVTITAGDYQGHISRFGAGPRALTYREKPLLVGYGEQEFPPMSSGIILAPWPNRVAEGVFAHQGVEHRLEITEPGRATSIHGLVGTMLWEVVEQQESSVTLGLLCRQQPGWPWVLNMRMQWSVDAQQGLRGNVQITNCAQESCPLGVGWHPYLSALGAPLDECTLDLPVSTVLPLDSVRNLPAGPEIPELAFRNGARPMRGVWLDHCMRARRSIVSAAQPESGMVKDQEQPIPSGGEGNQEAEYVRAELRDSRGQGVCLWADANFQWFQVFTADPAQREGYPGVGRALAVEPMTCPPNALRSGVDLLTLEAGETRDFSLGVRAITL